MWEWGILRTVNSRQTKNWLNSVCAYIHMNIVLPSNVREAKQPTDSNKWMFVLWKECLFKGTALSLSVCAGSFMIMPCSSPLSLPFSFIFFLCLWVSCMCALPQGKIRHELCKQALQSCFTLQTVKWNNWLLCSDSVVDGDSALVKYHYHSQTHNLSLSTTFPFSSFCLFCQLCISSYSVSSFFALLPPFLAPLTEDRWVNNTAWKRDTVSPEASFHGSKIAETHR